MINAIAREPIRLLESICPSLVYMHQAPAESSDPQTALAIAEQLSSIELFRIAWVPIGLSIPVDQPFDPATRADQQRAVIGFRETLDTVHLARRRIVFRRTG